MLLSQIINTTDWDYYVHHIIIFIMIYTATAISNIEKIRVNSVLEALDDSAVPTFPPIIPPNIKSIAMKKFI